MSSKILTVFSTLFNRYEMGTNLNVVKNPDIENIYGWALIWMSHLRPEVARISHYFLKYPQFSFLWDNSTIMYLPTVLIWRIRMRWSNWSIYMICNALLKDIVCTGGGILCVLCFTVVSETCLCASCTNEILNLESIWKGMKFGCCICAFLSNTCYWHFHSTLMLVLSAKVNNPHKYICKI